ncbi:hypothetical protein FRACYDRAFT_234929 [Fragilariopsis cylindrus CCMP1102]|uniref:Nudix hydrolase domain-containing protein n=1 Tax=Fragilariopsis cylindrus CCMP1102 TaxID=635003 RepID=A0A1E7FSZ6_9STRA|nr:hypothetical protein FRACYDRAFT_234929 [Fragilariopsis cylindrus CCMP1102]|eukprot:OEU21302.1 hypothetical protein FRACYDRAFT_234929 [Fragilariopsis cylindrus CCMP1102]
MGWMQHYLTTIPVTNYNSRLLSTSETIMRTNNNHNHNNDDDISRMRTRTPLSISPSRLFSSMSTTTDDNYRKEVPPAQQQILGVTLAGDYLIQMRVTSPFSSSSNVITASSTTSTAMGSKEEESEDEIIWTDGTRSSEALRYGLLSVSSSSSYSSSGSRNDNDNDCDCESSSSEQILAQLKPRVEVICLQNNENDYLKLGILLLDKDDNNNDDKTDTEVDKDFLLLLQLLQAQWVTQEVEQQQQQQQETNVNESLAKNKVNIMNKDNSSNIKDDVDDDNYNLQIPIDSLLSQHKISQLFSSNEVSTVNNVEWVEMMTGSSKIVGILPRSLVHKYNILHRGIGAFVTKDHPIPVTDFLAGESSELTAQREIAEELGLSKALSTSLSSWSNGQPIFTCLVCTGYNRCLVDLFQYVMDTSNEHIVWQHEEVAWGNFVNYNVIMASADLSMQRAALAGTWPGEYPPIQSELEGTIPSVIDGNDDDYIAWKEWDYVPDGLLVWKSWLEFLETSQKKTGDHGRYDTEQSSSSSSSFVGDNIDSTVAATRNSIVSFQVDFGVEEGTNGIITVELSSTEDIIPQSQQLAERFNVDVNDIQLLLQKSWNEATFIPTYHGPSLPVTSDTDSDDDRAECTIELPSGLVFELRPSTIGENAGLGLFVRKTSLDNTSDGGILQTQGSAFCGYGPCEKITSSVADLSEYQRQRSFEFILSDGLESYVWYEGNLLTVWEVMQSSSATGVQAHRLVEITAAEEEKDKDNFPPSTQLSLIHEGTPCYLIPPAERPDPKSLTIQTIGHMCNDLAGGVPKQTEEEYSTSSHRDNLLVLVPRVVVDDDGILQPSGMPILTLAKTVYIANELDSMEVGLRYGQTYWKNEL